MRVYGLFLAGIGVFFGIIGIIYWFLSYEDGGFAMLIGSALLGLLPGSYYLWWSNTMKPQADDDPDAEIAEGAGDLDPSRARASGRSSWAWGPSSPC